jgi:hypothetical protein
MAMARYTAAFSPQVGEDQKEAAKSHHVTVVGRTKKAKEVVAALKKAGCTVHHVPDPKTLAELVESGEPY